MRVYYPNVRSNDPGYLLRHVQELVKIAKRNRNSSSIIYACLDSRIALECCDLYLILASVGPKERQEVLESSKPKNGIDRLNSKKKTLKEKYQQFFQTLSEQLGISWNNYDFKKSKDLQHRLSTYIHSYYMLEDEVNYDSDIMQAAFPLIDEVKRFIERGLNFNGVEYQFNGIEMSTIPMEDRLLLNEWKDSNMSLEELRDRIRENLNSRETKS